MREYVFKLKIKEGSDEFWESLDKYDTAINEVTKDLNSMLIDSGYDYELELKNFHMDLREITELSGGGWA